MELGDNAPGDARRRPRKMPLRSSSIFSGTRRLCGGAPAIFTEKPKAIGYGSDRQHVFRSRAGMLFPRPASRLAVPVSSSTRTPRLRTRLHACSTSPPHDLLALLSRSGSRRGSRARGPPRTLLLPALRPSTCRPSRMPRRKPHAGPPRRFRRLCRFGSLALVVAVSDASSSAAEDSLDSWTLWTL